MTETPYAALQRRSALALDELGSAARVLRAGQSHFADGEGLTEACHQVLSVTLAAVEAAVGHLRGPR